MLSHVLLAVCFVAQGADKQDKASDKKQAQAVDAAVVKTLDDKEVRTVLSDWKKASRVKKPKLRQEMAAVEALGKGSHAKLVKPLASVVKKARPLSVKRAAAKALAHQPPKEARGAILKLIADRAVQQKPNVTADLITALDKTGYGDKDWRTLEKLFAINYTEAHRPKQKAIIVLAKNHCEIQAIRLLLENLDEPGPTDVNAADNPPAEYWEKRWKAWRSWRDDVKDALFEITGQRFSTAQEARSWIAKNRNKLKKRAKAKKNKKPKTSKKR